MGVKEWYKNCVDKLPDLDDVFSYDTIKEVAILDRRLGFVYYLFMTVVVVYIVLYVFIIERRYLDLEKSTGSVVIKVQKPQHFDPNPTYAGDPLAGQPWDVFDSVTNPGELGATFIPTRIVATRGQTQNQPGSEYCPSPVHECETDEDCDVRNELLQKAECINGMCNRRQWCPAENPDEATSTVHYLDWRAVELWFKAYVHFHKFFIDVSTFDEQNATVYPSRRPNTYAMHDLVRMANIDEEEVVENGAILMVNAMFVCDLGAERCQRSVESANVDTRTGFNYVHNHYYNEGGVRKRDTFRLYGIRVVAFGTGIGTSASPSMVILQISSAIALLGVASSVADAVMENLLPERNHYMSLKVLQTEDMNPD